MRIRIKLDNVDVSSQVILAETSLSKDINGRVGTCDLTFKATNSNMAYYYNNANYDMAYYYQYLETQYVMKEVLVENYDTNEPLFRGRILEIAIDSTGTIHKYKATIREYQNILDEKIVQSGSFTNQTDKAIIQSLFASFLSEVDTTDVSILGTLDSFSIKDKSLRSVLEDLAKITNAQFWLDASKALHWKSVLALTEAPYVLTNDRNDPNWFQAQIQDYKNTYRDFANRVIVLGGVDTNGAEIKSVANNVTSQGNRGLFEKVIINREITTQAVADILAESELDKRVVPQYYGSFVTTVDGFDVGQLLTFQNSVHGIDCQQAITAVKMSWYTQDLTKYEVTFGPKPEFSDILKQIKRPEESNTTLPSTTGSVTIPDGSITDSKIQSVSANKISGVLSADQITVTAASIQGSIRANQIQDVNSSSIIGTINSSQINSVNATVIQGSISGAQISSVNANTIQGVILSSQLGDDLINSLVRYSNSLRPIPALAAAPTLPDAQYPTGSFYYNTTNATFYKVVAGAWTPSNEAEAITGKFQFYNLGTIKAEKIIGMIVAAQIGSVNASAITGSIAAGQIGSVNASAITGSIAANQIGSVNAGSITGTIINTQIASVSAGTITGTISDAQIGSIAAGKVTGTISDSQIASITATKITGSITNSQITSIAGNKITGTISGSQIDSISTSILSGTISDSQIGSIAATKISGSIGASQIGAVNASAIVGYITANQISSVYAANISGTIAANQIASVNASAITGTIAAAQISSVNASVISGSITAAQIGSVYASDISMSPTEKLGTVYCSGNMHADGTVYGVSFSGNGTTGTVSAANGVFPYLQCTTISCSNPPWMDKNATVSASWDSITGKPSVFAPGSHSHYHTHSISVNIGTTTGYYNIQDYSGNWHYDSYVASINSVGASASYDATSN